MTPFFFIEVPSYQSPTPVAESSEADCFQVCSSCV